VTRAGFLFVAVGLTAWAAKLNIRTDCENNVCTSLQAFLEIDLPRQLLGREIEILIAPEAGPVSKLLVRPVTGTWSMALLLTPGRNGITIQSVNPNDGIVGSTILYVQPGDARPSLLAAAFVGLSLDSFASGELNRYINPDQNGVIKERATAGVSFQYRLLGRNRSQLWTYGETVHGVRSAGVDCSREGVCIRFEQNEPKRTLYMIRASTSLEARLGVRWEMLSLQPASGTPAAIYIKGQAGFLTIAGSGGDLLDVHHLAAGVIAKDGAFTGSYLELGVGKTELFPTQQAPRLKVEAHAQWPLFGRRGMMGFARITVDSNPKPGGADSVQSVFGVNFDLRSLF